MTKARKLRISLLLCVLIAAVAGGIFWWLGQYRPPDIERVGGTILVYEADRPEPLDAGTKSRLTDIVRKLAGFRHVTARNGNGNRVEVVVPRVPEEDHDAVIDQIKQRLSTSGHMELHVVANNEHDGAFLDGCRKFFEAGQRSKEFQEDMRRRARSGAAPPLPALTAGQATWSTRRGEIGPVTYAWVELSPCERAQGGWSDSAGNGQLESKNAFEAAAARAVSLPFIPTSDSMMVFSHKCENLHIGQEERQRKKYE